MYLRYIRTARRRPRKGWAKAFKEMAADGSDKLLDEGVATEWEKTEWVWSSDASDELSDVLDADHKRA